MSEQRECECPCVAETLTNLETALVLLISQGQAWRLDDTEEVVAPEDMIVTCIDESIEESIDVGEDTSPAACRWRLMTWFERAAAMDRARDLCKATGSGRRDNAVQAEQALLRLAFVRYAPDGRVVPVEETLCSLRLLRDETDELIQMASHLTEDAVSYYYRARALHWLRRGTG